MKTKIEMQLQIDAIINTIHQKFPELTKYILEIPEPNAKNEEVTLKNLTDYYESLIDIVAKYSKTHNPSLPEEKNEILVNPDLKFYPSSEDIYTNSKKETELDPEEPTKYKEPNEKEESMNEKDFQGGMSGGDLDVPGSELDDAQENNGNEDEENNYYSLGGDNHTN